MILLKPLLLEFFYYIQLILTESDQTYSSFVEEPRKGPGTWELPGA
jgi:hypothetical protein